MLKRFILWDFPRASWQYDVMVGVILAFIFLVPHAWFRDQPQPPDIIEMPPGQFFVPPKVLSNLPESQWADKVNRLLQSRRRGRHLVLTRVEPILNSEGELQGYMAFAPAAK
jgi:hypothetical protein